MNHATSIPWHGQKLHVAAAVLLVAIGLSPYAIARFGLILLLVVYLACAYRRRGALSRRLYGLHSTRVTHLRVSTATSRAAGISHSGRNV